MNIKEIRTVLGGPERDEAIEYAYRILDEKNNYAFLFGKTEMYYTSSDWDKIARDVKLYLFPFTKKKICELISLSRGASYYSALSDQAAAITLAEAYFGWDGTETIKERVLLVYNQQREVIEWAKALNDREL